MVFGQSAVQPFLIGNLNRSERSLASAMKRLASGDRLEDIGTAPAELALSERFRHQIAAGTVAESVMANGRNMLQTAAIYMDTVQEILSRMTELAVGSLDGLITAEDRQNYDIEYQQLRREIQRISDGSQYNQVEVVNRTPVSVWDPIEQRLTISQTNGENLQDLALNLGAGRMDANNREYVFESNSDLGSVGDYLFTDDGRHLVYFAQADASGVTAQRTIMILDLQENILNTVNMPQAGASGAVGQPSLTIDDAGRVWVMTPASTPSAGGTSFDMGYLDMQSMSLDFGGTSTSIWAGVPDTAPGYNSFAVFNDQVTYVNQSGHVVRQSLFDASTFSVRVSQSQYTAFASAFGVAASTVLTTSFSLDGDLLAYKVTVPSTQNTFVAVFYGDDGDYVSFKAGTASTAAVALGWDSNNYLYWTDFESDTLNRRLVNTTMENPTFEASQLIRQSLDGHLGSRTGNLATQDFHGLNLRGGNPFANFRFQVGPNPDDNLVAAAGDLGTVRLGLGAGLNLRTVEGSKQTLEALQEAVTRVSRQQVRLGAQVESLQYSSVANEAWLVQLSQAESRIRDTNIPVDTVALTKNQIMVQADVALVRQSNQFSQNLLALLLP